MGEDVLTASLVGQALIAKTGASNARDAIELLVRAALDDAEISKAPIDLRKVASYQGVRNIVLKEMAEAGRLVPLGSGRFEIHIRAKDPVERRNFTIGHEIGHLLLPGYREAPIEVMETRAEITLSNPSDAVEELCDIAAAALLMPMHLFGPAAAELGCHLSAVRALCRHFRSSWPATMRRMVETNLWRCALTVWNLIGGVPHLSWSFASDSFPFGLTENLTSRIDGGIGQLFTAQRSNTNVETLEVDGKQYTFAVYARRSARYGGGSSASTVTALLLPYPPSGRWPAGRVSWPTAPWGRFEDD